MGGPRAAGNPGFDAGGIDASFRGLRTPVRPLALAFTALVGLAACSGQRSPLPGSRNPGGTLIHSTRSEFSEIRVREQGSLRSLYFVEPGLEVRQTSIDLNDPGRLVVPYTRTMFASLLFKRPQDRVLVVGLGGGAMVRFLQTHFPRTRVDAVEIDPEVVRIARDYFGTRAGGNVRIFTEDAFRFLDRNHGKYDAIYMDAFLEPGEETDVRGIPTRLKTIAFLKSLQRHLAADGVVAFNLVEQPDLREDIATISAAFPSTHVFRVPGTKNFTVIATRGNSPVSRRRLLAEGRELDHRLDVGLSFGRIAGLFEHSQ